MRLFIYSGPTEYTLECFNALKTCKWRFRAEGRKKKNTINVKWLSCRRKSQNFYKTTRSFSKCYNNVLCKRRLKLMHVKKRKKLPLSINNLQYKAF